VITVWRSDSLFAKVRPVGQSYPIANEASRMRWARRYLAVPEVLECVVDDGLEWLMTAPLPGRDATTREVKADPATIVSAVARGLRRFHEALPVGDCPFDFRLDVAIDAVQRRHASGLIDHERDFHEEYKHLTLDEAVARLVNDRPDEIDVVVCHGDPCFPNFLVQDGEVTGYLDLGEVGVADRWWDLAVATWSVGWNVGPGWEDLFLESYGVPRDAERQDYYRLLYGLVS
jgi:kanamycin kinase